MATVDPSLVIHLPLFAGFSADELGEILREARSAASIEHEHIVLRRHHRVNRRYRGCGDASGDPLRAQR